MGTHPIFESDFDCLTEMSSQESVTEPMKQLAVESSSAGEEDKQEEKKESKTIKRKRSSRGVESPAKKPKELAKSASTSSLASSRPARGRPAGGSARRSLLAKLPEPPVATAYKIATQPRAKLLAFGMGDAGQLGMGEDIMERKRPQPVKEIDEKVISAAAGGMHNVFITESGDVFTFGCNDEGALGRKTQDEEECFAVAKVQMSEKGVECTAGDSHTAVITEEGDVWLWGTFRDANGRLGMRSGAEAKAGEGEKAVLHEPTKLDLPTKILRMASGADHLLLLDTTGQVYSLGCAESGQLGRLSSHFCQKGGRRGADKVLQAATIQLRKVTRKTGRIVDVACGQYSSFLISEKGVVLGFGLTNCYQMGFPDREIRFTPEVMPIKDEEGEPINVKQISSGMHHTLFLSDSGAVYAVGCGDYGRLGVGQKDTLRESKKALKVNLGSDEKVIAIGTGSCTSYAVLASGTVKAWGMGSNLQLATGGEDDEWEPIDMAGKQIDGKKAIQVAGGGQHAIMLIEDKEEEE